MGNRTVSLRLQIILENTSVEKGVYYEQTGKNTMFILFIGNSNFPG